MSFLDRDPAQVPLVEWAKLGAYENPWSRQRVPFLPLGVDAPEPELVLHEVGYLPRRPHGITRKSSALFGGCTMIWNPATRWVFRHREVELGPDRLVLIPDHHLFNTQGTEARPKFWLHFRYAFQPEPEQEIPIELAPEGCELGLIQILIRLLCSLEPEADRRRLYHGALALLHLVLSRPQLRWQTAMPENLLAVIRHIERNYAAPLYSPELDRVARMSETAFRRAFRRFRKVSPARFVEEVRVREAAHLMATTPLAMNLIAERTGFPNAAYLSRVFKRVTGEPPARSRRQAGASVSSLGAPC